MSVTLSGINFNALLAQPLTYQVSSIYSGASARSWEVQGLCSKADYASLISVYDTWRNAKIAEDSPEVSLVIGAYVSFSGSGPGGLTWSNVPCWFQEAPEGSMVSSKYMTVSFTVVDAAQALEVIIKTATETGGGGGGLEVDFGEYILNGATIHLTEYPDGYSDTPTIERTVNGAHYVSGALQPYQTKRIVGRLTESDVALVKSWYESIVQTTPVVGTWYPTSAPEFGAEYVGLVLWYTVSLDLQLIKAGL